MILNKEQYISNIRNNYKVYEDNDPCPKCNGKVIGYIWESSDGAYEDYHEFCTNLSCDYEKWVDGGDA